MTVNSMKLSRRPPEPRARARLAALTATSVLGLAGAAGCLLTSDFEDVANERPATPAPTDAGDESFEEAAAPSPCATGDHVVCSDFDHQPGGFPVPGWNNSTGDAGVISLDDTTAVTAPLSLHVKVKGENGTPEAYLYRTAFVGAFRALTLSFDLFIVACPPQGSSLTLAYVEPSVKASFGFVMLASGVQAVGAGVNGAFTFFQLEQQVPDQVWSHVVYRIMVKDASTAHFNLTVDGKKSVDTDAPSSAMKTTALLNLGILGSTAPAGCEVAFDNYVLDKE
jgi:hypothetical protein